jgi:hypothetical protein
LYFSDGHSFLGAKIQHLMTNDK